MGHDGMLGIGELAARAGVSVKTVRFYSDQGLLPAAFRSAGGHRRYAPEALDRLRLIRALRALDLPVPEITRVVRGQEPGPRGEPGGPGDALEDAVARQLRELGSQLAALRWREAALRLLHDCTAAERAERLLLFGSLSMPPSTAPMARFWRHWLPPRMPAATVSAVLDQTVPHLPAEPTPAQTLAFARLHSFVSASCEGQGDGQPAAHRSGSGYRPAALYEGLGEAHSLASPHLRARRAPHPGEALDRYIAAHADSLGVRDTPAFRRRLAAQLDADPRIDRYWQLTAEINGPERPTPGAADTWLRAALAGGNG